MLIQKLPKKREYEQSHRTVGQVAELIVFVASGFTSTPLSPRSTTARQANLGVSLEPISISEMSRRDNNRKATEALLTLQESNKIATNVMYPFSSQEPSCPFDEVFKRRDFIYNKATLLP